MAPLVTVQVSASSTALNRQTAPEQPSFSGTLPSTLGGFNPPQARQVEVSRDLYPAIKTDNSCVCRCSTGLHSSHGLAFGKHMVKSRAFKR
jgi:hypothetical protein